MVTTSKAAIYQHFAARLHEAADARGLPAGRGRATDLGRLVGVGYKGASKWLAGYGMPDMAHASQLAMALGVSFEWLMTGRGPKKVAPLMAAEARGAYTVAPLIHDNLRESIRLVLEELPADQYRLTHDARAAAIEAIYLCLNADGTLDMRKVLEVVLTPAKAKHGVKGEGKHDKRRKRGATKHNS